MAFSERQGGVSRPANGTVGLFEISSSLHLFLLFPLRLCTAPLKFHGRYSFCLDTKKRKGLVTNVPSGAVPWHFAGYKHAKSDHAEEMNNLERSCESWGYCSDLPNSRSFVCHRSLRF
ncbi:hypothetical protein ACSS6W_002320 [Trichoderma asperelloides]